MVNCQNTAPCAGAFYTLHDVTSQDFRVGLRWMFAAGGFGGFGGGFARSRRSLRRPLNMCRLRPRNTCPRRPQYVPAPAPQYMPAPAPQYMQPPLSSRG